MGDNTIYVAVNQLVRESKSTLLWALETLQVNKIFLLHVHPPFSLTPTSSRLTQDEIYAIQVSEHRALYGSLDKYRDICINKGVSEKDVDITLIPGYDVGKGIVELIAQNNIKRLVMGAAADSHYSKGMSITSQKAEYVVNHGPKSCEMSFICKGKLIKTSRGRRRDELANKPAIIQPVSRQSHDGSEADTSPSPPHDYICPITLEIMRDPHIAADGFTYEAEAIRQYLRTGGGRKNSPKTGEPLNNHRLIPNHNLRILINEWLQKHPNYRI